MLFAHWLLKFDPFAPAPVCSLPTTQVYTHVIAARVRMDMKMAFGEVKDTLKNIYQKKKKKK
jgi:hypothetical protein